MCEHECYLLKFLVFFVQLIGLLYNVKYEMGGGIIGNCPCNFHYCSFKKRMKN